MKIVYKTNVDCAKRLNWPRNIGMLDRVEVHIVPENGDYVISKEGVVMQVSCKHFHFDVIEVWLVPPYGQSVSEFTERWKNL